tara:strand:- start:558 stop:878 length:321 start_codon:yes stop_codon:yes gene_type:complete
MQQPKINNKLDNFCNELEMLSSKMAESFTLENYDMIKSIDSKRKLILKKISEDIEYLSNSNKKKLQLVWVNNSKLITKFEKKMSENKKAELEKKKYLLLILKTHNR